MRGRMAHGERIVSSTIRPDCPPAVSPGRLMFRHCRARRVVNVVFGAIVVNGFFSPLHAAALVDPPASAIAPIVVTASRSPQFADDVLSDVTVIGRDEIIRAGPGGLAALLQRQPGVEITRNGGPGAVSGLFLRGANPGQTVVLVDGVRVGSASTGAATLEAIPLEQVDRIEILRGPASGLYGADAIGGVVQVFTRGQGASSSTVSAGFGSHDTRAFTAGITGDAGPVRVSVQAGHRASRGFNAIDDSKDASFNPDRDGYIAENGSIRLALPWAQGQEVAASYLRNRLNAQFDGGPGHDDRTITVLESAQIESRNRLGPRWASRVLVAESVDDSVSRTGFGDFPFRTRQRQYSWLNDVTLPVGALTVGVERREERVRTDNAFAVTGRDTNAVLGVYQWRGEAHAVEANVRRDDSDQFGARTTGGAIYAYRVAPPLRLTVGWSAAFKAPSFNDLYFPDFSNPALRPETSRNFEAGVSWRATSAVGGEIMTWEARAAGYRNRVRDLIVFACDAQFVCAPQNVDQASLDGVTLTLDARRASTTLKASLDLQDPRERMGRLLPRRARQHAALTLGREWGPLRMGVEAVAATHRYDDAENARRLGGYGLVNLTVEWEMGQGWSALLRADNVFDRDYRLATQYANGGATVFAALRWQR